MTKEKKPQIDSPATDRTMLTMVVVVAVLMAILMVMTLAGLALRPRTLRIPITIGAGAGALLYVILYLRGWRGRGVVWTFYDFAMTVLAGLMTAWVVSNIYWGLIDPPPPPESVQEIRERLRRQ